jgi:tetratricopeptide (TPR) repeat protein
MLPTRLAPDFDELRTMTAERFYAFVEHRSVSDLRRTTANYAGSWHAVHMLQFGNQRLSSLFQTYLTGLARGEDDDHAWNSAFFGIDVAARYQDYLGDDYKIGRVTIRVHAPREPSIHTMSQVDVALLRARLYGWSSSEYAEAALEYLEFAASKEPSSPEVMLHLAAFNHDTGGEGDGEQWLARALKSAPTHPEVLATAILWFSRKGTRESRREDLDAWAEALAGSAQTAFQVAELGEYASRVAGDPKAALRQFDKSLKLDAARWRTYALAGEAFEALGQREKAIRAYSTAIALTGHEPSALRSALKRRIDRLRRQ